MAYLTQDRQKEILAIIDDIKLKTGYSYPELDIMDLAKALGVSVFVVSFSQQPQVNALLVYADERNDKKPTVYINRSLPKRRKRFTLAHELGHFVLHRSAQQKFRVDNFNYDSDSQNALEESEANFFAAAILVPETELKKLATVFGAGSKVLSEYFGVSNEVIENRLQWLKANPLV